MASLDEVYEQMRVFERALAEFNQEIQASASALAASHEEVCGIWKDEASVRYRQTYEPLAQSLDHYLRSSAPGFERFLETKIRQLEQYLNGT